MCDQWFSKDKFGEGEKRLWRNWNSIEETDTSYLTFRIWQALTLLEERADFPLAL